MKLFFITYGNNLIGCYSTIKAEDYSKAREIAFMMTDGKFAFFYEGEEELQRQLDLGYLNRGEVQLQPMDVD